MQAEHWHLKRQQLKYHVIHCKTVMIDNSDDGRTVVLFIFHCNMHLFSLFFPKWFRVTVTFPV